MSVIYDLDQPEATWNMKAKKTGEKGKENQSGDMEKSKE